MSSGNGSSSVSSSGNWGSGNMSSNCSLGDSLDGVGAGLVDDWLVDGLVSTDGSSDGLGSVGGDVLEDGLGNVVGLDNGSGLVGSNGGGDMGVGGLSYGVG